MNVQIRGCPQNQQKIRAAAPARSASIHDRCKAVFEGAGRIVPSNPSAGKGPKDWPGKADAHPDCTALDKKNSGVSARVRWIGLMFAGRVHTWRIDCGRAGRYRHGGLVARFGADIAPARSAHNAGHMRTSAGLLITPAGSTRPGPMRPPPKGREAQPRILHSISP
jgi:hypothetical protein